MKIGDHVRHTGQGMTQSVVRYAAGHTSGTITKIGKCRVRVRWASGASKLHKPECLEVIEQVIQP